MRENLCGTKQNPHPEPVEGRTQSIQGSLRPHDAAKIETDLKPLGAKQ
jgi:hypothetical protein